MSAILDEAGLPVLDESGAPVLDEAPPSGIGTLATATSSGVNTAMTTP